MDRHSPFMDPILASLNQLTTHLGALFKAEYASHLPLMERHRPAMEIHQKKDPNARRTAPGLLRLARDKGDLVIHRGSLVLATLSIDRLWTVAEGLPIALGFVYLYEPDIVTFFHHYDADRYKDRVILRVLDGPIAERRYGLDLAPPPSHHTIYPSTLVMELEFASALAKLNDAIVHLKNIDSQRAMLAKTDTLWHEDPELAKALA